MAGDDAVIEKIEALVIPTAAIGAPTVLLEKIPSGREIIHAVNELETALGRKAHATMPVEVGGANSTVPLFVGATLGIPVVDADGMGRAFPEMQMGTFGVHGISITPAVISNEHLDSVLIKAGVNVKTERIARSVTVQMGGSAYASEYPMSGSQVKRAAIPNTLSLAIRIGRQVREAKERNRDPVAAILDLLPETHYRTGRVIFEGKVIDVQRRFRGGFSMGEVAIEGHGSTGTVMSIMIQNENLVARVAGEVRAIVPDLICILDADTADPITTERLRYGQRVRVLAIAVPGIMRTKEALDVFGPGCFGIDEPFVPLEAMRRDDSDASPGRLEPEPG